jgi:hypothetical protein
MAINTEQFDAEQWVDDCIASLKAVPECQPDVERRFNDARQLEQRRKHRRRAASWTALAFIAACLLVLSFPSSRARAQLELQRLALRGIQITGVRPDLYSALLFEWTIPPVPAHLVRGPDAAAAEAGFVPNLPDWTMVSQPVPSFGIGIMGGGAGSYVIRAGDLRAALRRAAVTDIEVPDAWDGVHLGLEISPRVYLNARGFFLIQFQRDHIDMPAGFPLSNFVEALLRIGGLSKPQAHTLAEKTGFNPASLIGIPSGSALDIREISLLSGPAVLVQNPSGQNPPNGCFLCPGLRETVLAWQTPDRSYILKTELNEARAVAVANSLP